MIAVREAYEAGLLRRDQWLPNIVAGTIVGIVALPLAMAFAIATGARPEQGIYTAIIAALVVSLFGGSRLQIAGPTGAFVVILSSIVNTHGIAGLQLATLMAGMVLILMGIFRLGMILRFIPAPVIVGFTAGIGVVIWVGQWASFFGLPPLEGEHVHEKVISFFSQVDMIDPATTVLAVAGLLIVIHAPRLTYLRRIPSPLIAMIIITSIQAVVGFPGVATIGSTFGGIPLGIPPFAPPAVSLDLVLDLLGPAFTIAMLGAIESLLSAVVADGMAGTHHNSNQELKGQGLANIAVACFGGIAATGAIARTATNIRNGATSPLAGVTHSVVLLAIILVLAPLASSIPLAVLAAILFVVAWNMSEARHVVRMIRRAPLADVTILLITFGLTVAADLVIAVNVGVLLATVHFLHRMASSVEVRRTDHQIAPMDLPEGVAIYSIEGPFFFAAVESFEHTLAQTHTDPEGIVIRLGNVPFVDITGIETLREIREDFEERDVRVVFTEANQQVRERLLRAGVITEGSTTNYRPDLPQALALASHNDA